MRRRTNKSRPRNYSSGEDSIPPLHSVHHYRGRVRAIITACFIGVILALTSSRSRSKSPRQLPETYAICSHKDSLGAIYTIDNSLPNVDCVVVRGNTIVDRGSVEDVRRVWGDRDTTGPPTYAVNYGFGRWKWGVSTPKTGTKVYFLKSGEALYPGFVDAHAHILGVYFLNTHRMVRF